MAKKDTAPAVDFTEGESLVVDFNDVEDAGFDVLPAALYPVTVEDCEFVYSQSSGNPMWTLKMSVDDGEYAGRFLWSHLVFAGKGAPFTKKTLSRINPSLLEGPFNPEDQEVIAGMLGLQLKAKVTVRKYQGQDSNNVRDLFLNEGGDDFLG
jgi:hypothetical protein